MSLIGLNAAPDCWNASCIEQARSRLNREEVELDEISKETAQSYLDKSKGQPSIVPKEDKRPFVKALQARTSKRFQGRRRAQERLDK